MFTSPSVLDSLDYGVALNSLETFHPFPNIEDGDDNVFAYETDSAQPSQLIYIPTGNYEINKTANKIRRQTGDSV